MAFTSFVSGLIGFHLGFAHDNQKDFVDIIYYALQLFTFQSLPDGLRENGFIKFAKLFAPVSIALFSFQAFYLLLSEHIMMLNLSTYKNHVVICGLGTKGMFFVNRSLSEGKKVAVIEKSNENIDITACKSQKVPVIIGDISEDVILNSIRYQYASSIYILTGNDMINISTARKLRDNIVCNLKSSGHKKVCYTHINSIDLKTCIEGDDWITTGTECFELRLFNIYEMVSRCIVKDIPIEPSGKSVVNVENPSVIVIGFSAMGNALVKQLIRMKVYPNDKRLKITIIDKDAYQHQKIFHSIYSYSSENPKLVFKNVEIAFVSMDIYTIHAIDDLKCDKNADLPHNIYICIDDDVLTEILTNKIKTSIPPDTKHEIKIISCYTGHSVKTEKFNNNPKVEIYKINIKEEGCRSLIDLDKIDTIARMIHSNFFNQTFRNYNSVSDGIKKDVEKLLCDTEKSVFEKEAEIRKKYPEEVNKIVKEKPSRKPWHELKEEFKNSNRHQADHIIDKIRALNPNFTLRTNHSEIEKAINKGNNLDLLAELEYKRYWAEKHVLGQKIDFKPFDKIEENEKDLNREIIRSIPKLIRDYQKRGM
ncbi:MAG: NAD-binding protein [Thermodesulfovibrionales bacterium]|nr:NAD-binding protein [Thermodesulfovibrionales bacterium]